MNPTTMDVSISRENQTRTPETTLAGRIQQLRRQRGISQEELAGAVKVSRQAVSKWENSTANPDINNLIQLSELYRVSTDYILFGGSPAREPSAPDHTEQIKETPSAYTKRHTNGYLWLGLIVLAVLLLYFIINGFL